MSSMVERVAVAIVKAESPRVVSDDDALAYVRHPNYGPPVIKAARSAIAAMREPTEAMLEAGKYYASDAMRVGIIRDWRPHNAKLCWQEMIDAELTGDAEARSD